MDLAPSMVVSPETVWIVVAVVAVLLGVAAFFSLAETALTAASRPLMHQLEKRGSRRARLVNQLRRDKERLIGTILFGNNLVNILTSALTTGLMIALFGEAGVAYATVVVTVLVLIFTEVMPKVYALEHADRTALAVALPIRALSAVFHPVVVAVRVLVNVLLRLFGLTRAHTPTAGAKQDELRGAIEMHSGDDHQERHERDMLKSVLDLAEVEVSEVMTHRKSVIMIDADQPAGDIVDQVVASPYTRIPLYRGSPDNVIGVLHAKALLRAVRVAGGDLKGTNIIALAARPWFIPETTSLRDQLQAFRDKREHFALVVDEYGTLLGIVTLEDILEEIVGDIADEHDVTVIGVRPQADGGYLVDGTVTIRDLNRRFDWNLPDEEAATIAGLVLHETRRIPKEGQVFRFHGLRFEVLRRKRNQITLLRLSHDQAGERPAAIPPQTTA